MAGTLKQSPLHDRHEALGAKFAEFGGWSMPLEYATGVVKEHTAVREAVGIFDVSHLGKAMVSGPGAADFVNATLSNDLAKAGNPPEAIDTKAAVTFVPGTGITGVALAVTGKVPGLTAEQFEEAAQAAKEGCPVSQALKVPITLEVSFTE